jgi:hypothetical protein
VERAPGRQLTLVSHSDPSGNSRTLLDPITIVDPNVDSCGHTRDVRPSLGEEEDPVATSAGSDDLDLDRLGESGSYNCAYKQGAARKPGSCLR